MKDRMETALIDFVRGRIVRNSPLPTADAELLDRHGEHLQSLRIDMTVRRLDWVKLDTISPALLNAVLLAEDQRFYQHEGIDLQALVRAAWDNLFHQRPRGASTITITMQLASMLDPALQPKQGVRNLTQKWDQMQAARDLEKSWSKPQILEAYLNLVTYRTVCLAKRHRGWMWWNQ